MDISGFIYRRLSRIATCTFNFSGLKKIKLSDKYHISSFQDVLINPFYWDSLSKLNFKPLHILDIGANLGFFPILCHEFFSYKYSDVPDFTLIEANPFIIEKLKKNIERFKIKKYNLINAAAGLKTEFVDFYIDKKTYLSSSIMQSGLGKNKMRIRSANLHDALYYDIDLIKIDIEGAEYALCDNYFDTIKKAKAVIVELHSQNKEMNRMIEEKFCSAGFEVIVSYPDPQSGYQLYTFQKVSVS